MIGAARTLWETVREFDVAQIRKELEQPIRIRIVGSGAAECATVAALLGGEAGASAVVPMDPPADDTAFRELTDADLVLFLVPADPAPTLADMEALHRVAQAGVPSILVVVGRGATGNGRVAGSAVAPAEHPSPDPRAARLGVRADGRIEIDLDRTEQAEATLERAVSKHLGARRLGLARQIPRLRDRIADQLISETAGANARFALLSSLPGWLPIIGGLAGNVADLAVLTKNQVLLVLKLAGIYGRDLAEWRPLLLEILPVIGGAFVWRTVARSLAAMLPQPLSPIPKTAIAYVGTATVGEIARRYYRDGVRLNPQAIRSVQDQAVERFRAVAARRLRAPAATI